MDWSTIGQKLAQISGTPSPVLLLLLLLLLLCYCCLLNLGIVETGLFVNMAAKVYYGTANGTVRVVEAGKK